jgi:hypothetical protein
LSGASFRRLEQDLGSSLPGKLADLAVREAATRLERAADATM